MILLPSAAEAAYLNLAWDPNQESDLAGYRVYYGTSSGEYINFVDAKSVTSYRLDDLLDGVTYYIALTAYDRAGNESDFSGEVSGLAVTDDPPTDDPDSDGDGMLDDWEIGYFGDLSEVSDGDYDGDGITNLEEYLGGTDPSSAACAYIGKVVCVYTRVDVATPYAYIYVRRATKVMPELYYYYTTDPEIMAIAAVAQAGNTMVKVYGTATGCPTTGTYRNGGAVMYIYSWRNN